MTRLRFVLAPGQNRFWVELATALAEEVRSAGGETTLETGPLPDPEPGDAFVLAPPHEYAALLPGREPTSEQLGRCIAVCGERPGTPFFEANVRMCRSAGALFDINTAAVEAFAAAGLPARLLTIGWTASWDRCDPAAARDVDIAFVGCLTPRRARVLARLYENGHGLRGELVLSDNSRGPNDAPGPSYLDEEAKRELLSRTRVLLNVHQDEIAYFERLRAVQAACCGAVVLTETGDDVRPFGDGEVAVAPPGRMAAEAAALARDGARLAALRSAAYSRVRDHVRLADAARDLLAVAPAVAARPWPGLRTDPAAPPPTWEPGPRLAARPLPVARPGGDEDEPELLLPHGCELRGDALERLRAALDAHPGAAFAYGISVRDHGDGDGVVLDGAFGWEPGRQRPGDLVDGPILAAPEALRAARAAPGGRDDPRSVLVSSAVVAVQVRDVLARLNGAQPARG